MSKTLHLLLFCCSFFAGAYGQLGQWSWMSGDSIHNPLPVFGTLGIPSTLNKPPPRYEAAEWTDLQGNFWMFGGNDQAGIRNDLWKFDPATLMWTWISGSQLVNQSPTYGTMGVPSTTNTPGARGFGCATWTDKNGYLWLFGGTGYSTMSGSGFLNDLWRFNPATNEWTWMKGSNGKNDYGHYGTKLISASSNLPRSRSETSASWVDSLGNFWLFGGNPEGAQFNDLWKFSPSMNEWTWMHGDTIPMQAGKYGLAGVAGSANCPGSRWPFAKWQLSQNAFLLFGGFGRDVNGAQGRLNDLWKFNALTNQWTWIGGSKLVTESGIMDSLCGNAFDIPSGRQENRSAWQIQQHLIMFGGYNAQGFYNDLWAFDYSSLKWKWIAGDALPNQPGLWGTYQIGSIHKKPCARWGSVGWTDLSGNLWLFGGQGTAGYYNDLWKFVPDLLCLNSSNPVGLMHNEPNTDEHFFPNPFNESTQLALNHKSATSLDLYDSQSNLVLRVINPPDNKLRIEKNTLQPGLYFFTIYDDAGQQIKKGKLFIE